MLGRCCILLPFLLGLFSGTTALPRVLLPPLKAALPGSVFLISSPEQHSFLPQPHILVYASSSSSHAPLKLSPFYSRIGVYGYAIVYGAVVILPLFINYDILASLTIFLYNLAMWGFTAWLLWTFRCSSFSV